MADSVSWRSGESGNGSRGRGREFFGSLTYELRKEQSKEWFYMVAVKKFRWIIKYEYLYDERRPRV